MIADEYVDREFGTGCLKITPAHDFNDWQIGQRHKLHPIGVLTLDAKINEQRARDSTAGSIASRRADGSSRISRHRGCWRDVKPHTLMVPRCGRTNEIVEPMLTDQWYVNMESLAQLGLELRRVGRGPLRTGELDHHLQPVAHEHPGLVHLAPALVGPPHSGLVRRGRQRLRRARRG